MSCKKFLQYHGCYQYTVKQTDKFHLTGKPTPLMEKLVQIVPENAVVLDPFVGSGTNAVAAKMHNRNFVGFERTQIYYDIALERLEKLNISK